MVDAAVNRVQTTFAVANARDVVMQTPKEQQFQCKCTQVAKIVFEEITGCDLDSINATSFDDVVISADDCFRKAIHIDVDSMGSSGGSGHRFCVVGLPCNQLKASTANGVVLDFAYDAPHGVYVVLQANANPAFAPPFALHEKPLLAMTSPVCVDTPIVLLEPH
jgi:hypothetical protein